VGFRDIGEGRMDILKGKTAIVTGGGTGIGLAIARRFYEEGAAVVICGRREERLREAAGRMVGGPGRIYPLRADVTVEEDIHALVRTAEDKTGRLDILVNNAGVMRFDKLEEADSAQWDLLLETNVRAPWRLMTAALPALRRAGGGSIINLSSIAGIKAFPGAGLYCTSKAALQALSQVMAMEAAADGIRVNVICPALVEETELADPIFGPEKVSRFYETMRPLHPLGRSGRPPDIAEAALFLASGQSSWVTGVILPVDGGRQLATNRPPT
jgi:NAD(P)-dependent dehydrogenase (short-subunit alcohol dehydrogenase family)